MSQDDAKVIGHQTAASGVRYGVWGEVESADGYGLYTPDDAKVDGTAELAAIDTRGGDFELAAGTSSTNDATNVVLGHEYNEVIDGATAATIAGGGYDDGSNALRNIVSDDYGTVGGGLNNRAGSTDGDPSTAQFTTVGGGRDNTASNRRSTVGGGDSNTASGSRSTVGGGENNTAAGYRATVGGGGSNEILGTLSNATIAGGFDNTIDGATDSVIGGGVRNTITTGPGSIGGGWDNSVSGEFAHVGGGRHNDVGANYATIAGGGPSDTTDSTTREDTKNVIFDDYGTIGGGGNNQAGYDGNTVAEYATIGGGLNNEASGWGATVGGGDSNSASNMRSTVGGGGDNTASAWDATVSGGRNNTASTDYATVGGGGGNLADGWGATVPGGTGNTASGQYSLAVGAEATASHDGAYVFGDSSSTGISSKNSDEARFQVDVYAPTVNETSARAAKTDVEPVDPEDVLERVEDLEVSTWEYREHDNGRHMGPMAGEFHDAFELGEGDGVIAAIDRDGVALAAIKGLAVKLATKDERITELEAENEQLRERMNDFEDRLAASMAGQSSSATADD